MEDSVWKCYFQAEITAKIEEIPNDDSQSELYDAGVNLVSTANSIRELSALKNATSAPFILIKIHESIPLEKCLLYFYLRLFVHF